MRPAQLGQGVIRDEKPRLGKVSILSRGQFRTSRKRPRKTGPARPSRGLLFESGAGNPTSNPRRVMIACAIVRKLGNGGISADTMSR